MRILITGGAGYFGRGFVKTLLDRSLASKICIYSRGEFAQATMRHELKDDDRLRWFIGDVRDQDRLERAMHEVGVVVHGAALKRTEVCAYNVMECIATNVIGTQNVAKACIDAGVKKAVLLNSDKSVLATTTYGLSKAIAERIFLNATAYSGAEGTKFCSCVYGNIAGSTGSVIPLWRKQLETSDTVTVTDPEATRFWMLRHQAADLVLNAIQSMQGGEVFIPDLPAFRVGDLAEAMGAKMNVIGMAPNEKLHEEMRPGETSDMARRMSIDELRKQLQCLESLDRSSGGAKVKLLVGEPGKGSAPNR